jgi:hypothetical protein
MANTSADAAATRAKSSPDAGSGVTAAALPTSRPPLPQAGPGMTATTRPTCGTRFSGSVSA